MEDDLEMICGGDLQAVLMIGGGEKDGSRNAAADRSCPCRISGSSSSEKKDDAIVPTSQRRTTSSSWRVAVGACIRWRGKP